MAIFQSTQPEWAATDNLDVLHTEFIISIHAARVGCDINAAQLLAFTKKFQSTQPEWAATKAQWYIDRLIKISIHAARVGCDKTR